VALLREPGARYAPARASALGLRAIVLASLSIGLMVVDHRQQHLQVIRSWLTAAAYPFQVAVHSPLAGWQWLTSNFATRATLLEENKRLKSEQWRNDLRLLRFEAVEQENRRLRELVAAAPRAGERAMLAEILRVDLDPFRHRVIIDRGSHDGVTKGQAVVDGRGVFGQVTNVGPYSAEVILLSDAAHAIPVQISRNGLRTIAVGTGEPRRLQLPYLPRNADVKQDDELLTSGLGGIFPGGYPVGRVVEVKRDPSQPLAIVNAEPAAALDRDNEVLLVWFTPRPAGPVAAVDTKPAAAPAAAPAPTAPAAAPPSTGAASAGAAAATATTPATPPSATPAAAKPAPSPATKPAPATKPPGATR
jgi:rod shape-determining protein MreC